MNNNGPRLNCFFSHPSPVLEVIIIVGSSVANNPSQISRLLSMQVAFDAASAPLMSRKEEHGNLVEDVN